LQPKSLRTIRNFFIAVRSFDLRWVFNGLFPLQVLGQWSGLFNPLPPPFMRDFMKGFTILNVNILPFMRLECVGLNLGLEPGSYFYTNIALKASIPLWLMLFSSGAFIYLRRKAKVANAEELERISGHKGAVIVFTLFMLNILHPRCVSAAASAPSHPSSCRHQMI
jgi:hypothetical protein